MLQTYQQAQNELEKDFSKKFEFLKEHKNLFPIAHEYAEKYAANHGYDPDKNNSNVGFAADTGTIQALGLHLMPGGDENIQSALTIVDEMIKDPRLEMIKPLDKEVENKWQPIDVIFKERGSKSSAQLYVRIHLYQSTVCKEVGTGRYKEIMKVVCE